MITTVHEERLVITSDVHLGNVLFRSRRPFLEFLERVADEGYSICVNGDGVDLAQLSFIRFTRDLAKLAGILRQFTDNGVHVHYVVGNHDMVLEHFLHNWGGVNVVPFLNVHSGSARIRVEHGHIYDTMFVKHPRLYHAATAFGGWCLWLNPRVYHAFKGLSDRCVGLVTGGRKGKRAGEDDHIVGEPASFMEAAREISARGFDAVVFGHTHLSGEVPLPDGARYFNTGSWLFRPHYVQVREGSLSLHSADDG